MKNTKILGLVDLAEIDTTKLYKCFTRDIIIKFSEDFNSINKIYLKSVSRKIKNIISMPYKKVLFIEGEITFRIEYSNTTNTLVFSEFKEAFSEEFDVSKYIDNINNINVNIFNDIFVNNIWIEKTSENSLFIAAFLTSTLEFI